MARSTLADAAATLGVAAPPGADAILIEEIQEDSRRITAGALFVAISGTHEDGGRYAADAVRRGAVAVVSEHPLPNLGVPVLRTEDTRLAAARLASALQGHPTEQLFTVGVTGTNGKTTVCHLTAHLLGEASTKVIGTVANVTRGLASVTTPPAATIQRIARCALNSGARHLVVEASSIGIEQRRTAAIDFDVAVFTNLTHDHLDAHGTMNAYLNAKRQLFLALKPAATAIVNADDEASVKLVDGIAANVVTYGLHAADLTARNVRRDTGGSIFDVQCDRQTHPVRIPLAGSHNVANALAALAVARVAGIPLQDASAALATARSVPGRYQVLVDSRGVRAVVDYAHTPDALRRILAELRPAAPRLLVVFGCQGGSDREKRPIMGELAGDLADGIFLTNDNPKMEDPEAILEEIANGARRTRATCSLVPDRAEAIRRAVAATRPGDTLLIAGKGHEAYQIVGNRFVPHSDVEALRALGFSEPDIR